MDLGSLNNLLATVKAEILACPDSAALAACKQRWLSKKGELNTHARAIGQAPPEHRAVLGEAINKIKLELTSLLDARMHECTQQELSAALTQDSLDITLPGRRRHAGSLHPVTVVMQRLEHICHFMGFTIATGPEIENDYYNFTALNVPPLHPARSMADTFYCDADHLLRTHTSPVQIRFLSTNKPPVRMIASGKVYRRDYDASHTPMFHQLEGLVVDGSTTFAALKGLVHEVLAAFFAQTVTLRFRPSYFPFTEPSAEVDLACLYCNSKGCPICGHTGWLEVLGCGMIHPNILRRLDIDPEVYQGCAFGVGCDRLALLYYNIPDLRLLFDNDRRFLAQF